MDLFTLILVPFLVGVLTNRVDQSLIAPTIEKILNYFWHHDQQANQELEKALKISLLSAVQTIARECHQELVGSSPVQYVLEKTFYPAHREELQWLDRKIQQLAKEIKQVKRAEQVLIPLKSIDEIALLLTSEGELTEEKKQFIINKLISEILENESDNAPELYITKIKETLFDRVRDNVESEIKHNPIIHDIFASKMLANIYLQNRDENAENQQSETRRRLKLELDIEKLNGVNLEEIVQHLQKLLNDDSLKLTRIEEGCMELIFDGSQKGLEKLDALVKSGELTEILNIPIQRIDSNILSRQSIVNLGKWLENVIDTGWQNVEEVLGTQRTNLLFAVRGAESMVIRAEQIQLEIESNVFSLALIVAIIPKIAENRDIRLQVHTSDGKNLPRSLKFIAFDMSGKHLLEVESKNTDNWVQLDISGKQGEEFSVQIQLDDVNITRIFMI